MTDTILFIIFGVVAVIPLFQIVLSKLLLPVRLEFAELGYELLQHEDTDEEQVELIDRLLDDAFNWRFGFALALTAMPVGLYLLVARIIGADVRRKNTAYRKLQSTQLGDKFLNYFVWCLLGSNPLAGVVAMVQIFPIAIFLALISGGIKKSAAIVEEDIFVFLGTASRV